MDFTHYSRRFLGQFYPAWSCGQQQIGHQKEEHGVQRLELSNFIWVCMGSNYLLRRWLGWFGGLTTRWLEPQDQIGKPSQATTLGKVRKLAVWTADMSRIGYHLNDYCRSLGTWQIPWVWQVGRSKLSCPASFWLGSRGVPSENSGTKTAVLYIGASKSVVRSAAGSRCVPPKHHSFVGETPLLCGSLYANMRTPPDTRRLVGQLLAGWGGRDIRKEDILLAT